MLATRRLRQPWTLACAALVLSVGLAEAQKAPPTLHAAEDVSRATEGLVRVVSPAIVQIFTTSYVPADGNVARLADLVTTQHASGSGVIVDPDGYIVTNAHVVAGATRLRVDIPLPPGGDSILARRSRTVEASVVGLDVETDLAVIKIDERDCATLPFGDSDLLRAGQIVLAFGSPLGLDASVSLGIVSVAARQLEPESPMIYVQTDASINSGSSGGPLVDLQGRIVGINTLLLARGPAAPGPSFSAPSNIVRTVYEQIRRFGRVRRGDIGLRAQTVTPILARGLALPRDRGVVIADVIPGSPAEQAGLLAGDMILSLDGRPVENGRQLAVGLYRRMVGEVVTLETLRDAAPTQVAVVMTERRELAAVPKGVDLREHMVARLGILGLDLTEQIRQLLPSVRLQHGVVVASTVAGGTDSRAGGFAPGDVIYAINRIQVSGVADLKRLLATLRIGDAIVVHLQRGAELMYLAFTLE